MFLTFIEERKFIGENVEFNLNSEFSDILAYLFFYALLKSRKDALIYS